MISVCVMGIESPGNAGAIARSMRNFGLKDLYFVNPQCEVLSEEGRQRAMGGIKILEKSKQISIEELKKFDTIIGTSAILGNDYNIPRNSMTIKELTERKKELNVDSGNTIIVFGRESSGLTNEEISLCDFLISIPANPEYNTFNISHAATLVFYELYFSDETNKKKTKEIFPYASRTEKDLLNGRFDEIINKLDFTTEEKKETQELVWKRLISKSFLTKREAFALFGLLKKIDEKIDK